MLTTSDPVPTPDTGLTATQEQAAAIVEKLLRAEAKKAETCNFPIGDRPSEKFCVELPSSVAPSTVPVPATATKIGAVSAVDAERAPPALTSNLTPALHRSRAALFPSPPSGGPSTGGIIESIGTLVFPPESSQP